MKAIGQNNMPHSVILVLVLVGLPASGKSTIARSLVRLAAARHQQEQQEEQNADNPHGSCLSSLHYIEYDDIQESILTTDDECVSSDKESSSSKNDGSHQTEHGHEHEHDDAASSLLLEAWRRSRLMALDRLGDLLQQQRQQKKKKLEKQLDDIDGTKSSSSSSSSSFVVVLLDDNFHLRSMRKQVYQTCQQALMTNMTSNNNATTAEEINCIVNSDVGGNGSSSSHVERGYTIFLGSVYVNTPLEVCLERNRIRREQQRQQQEQQQVAHTTTTSSSSLSSSRHAIVQLVSDETILSMSQSVEPPVVGSKASWEVDGAILTLNGCRPINDLVQEVQRYIQVFYQASLHSLMTAPATADVPASSLPAPVRAMVDPAAEAARLEEERRKTRACFQHQLELSSRQWVAAVAKIRPQQARVANQIRKEMLAASFQPEKHQQDELQTLTSLQKSIDKTTTTTTTVSPADQDGNCTSDTTRNHTTTTTCSADKTLELLRRQFAEKVWNSTNKMAATSSESTTTSWTDDEKNQLWMELSS